MSECLFPFNVAFALQKDSVLTTAIGATIERLSETGFFDRWIEEELDKVAVIKETKQDILRVRSKQKPSNAFCQSIKL